MKIYYLIIRRTRGLGKSRSEERINIKTRLLFDSFKNIYLLKLLLTSKMITIFTKLTETLIKNGGAL